jgi:glutathionyl-hydroquinone reductase
MKDIYQTNGIASTVNFEHIKKVYQVYSFLYLNVKRVRAIRQSTE